MTRTLEIPNPHRRAIDVVKEVAAEKECRPFLAGGPVRDLLLGRPVSDVDLTLEEGSSVLARALAKRIEGRVRSFPQFLTYKVSADGFPEIDIATARKEKYRSPGSLPTVSEGKLRDDLLRRDFSINAIAMDLLDGTIHDPADGQKDLHARVIRVLHDASFIDDPTRIFRAIRLSKRLNFTIEPHTAQLMRMAIAGAALSTVSRERLWRELFLAMDEREAPKTLVALHKAGALVPIFGSELRAGNPDPFERIRRQVEAQPALDRYVLYTGMLLRGTDATAPNMEGSGFSQKRTRAVLQIARDLSRFKKVLSGAVTDRQRFRVFKTMSPELLMLLVADRPDLKPQVERFQDFQKFKLPLRGNDLEVPVGPHIARALERTREAVFTGEIPPDQARIFARDLAIKYLSREQPADPK
jgi:tRNA nucleotidyltransferase (CCA-adding enzyme)